MWHSVLFRSPPSSLGPAGRGRRSVFSGPSPRRWTRHASARSCCPYGGALGVNAKPRVARNARRNARGSRRLARPSGQGARGAAGTCSAVRPGRADRGPGSCVVRGSVYVSDADAYAHARRRRLSRAGRGGRGSRARRFSPSDTPRGRGLRNRGAAWPRLMVRAKTTQPPVPRR
jgi:hypothetical protein